MAPVRGRFRDIAAAAVAVVLGMQCIRVLFPLLFRFGEENSFIGAGVFGLAVFAAPVLAAPVRRVIPSGVALPASIGALALLRLSIQVVHPVPLSLATAAVAVALLAWALLLADGPGPWGFAVGLLAGLALDTGLKAAFVTWDYAWQEGWVPLVLTIGLGVAAVVLAERGRERPDRPLPPPIAVASFGPFLMLQALFLQSPAYVASQSGVTLPTAVVVVLVGDALALLAIVTRVTTPAARAGLALAVAAVGVAIPLASGGPVLGIVVLGHVVAAALLGGALAEPGAEAEPSDEVGPPRASPRGSETATTLAFALGTVGFVLLALLYQIDHEIPLGIPNELIPIAAAGLLALGALRRPSERLVARTTAPAFAMIPVVLLVVPVGLWLARPSTGIDRTPRSSIRVVSYNIHLAVNTEGQVDPAAIARVIEREEPHAVVLQEVGRGWAIGGMTDLAEWLAWHLEMPYAYRHAADRQFGNAILTRLPVVGIESGSLPFGRGPQSRSWLRVEVALEGGSELDLIGTHLQHQEDTDTRLRQIEALLEAWGGSLPAVIAGDMNAQPADPELQRFVEAGLVSAQDEIGDPSRSTVAIPLFPGDRIDYVFGAGVTFEAFRIPLSFASDHLPLAVTVSPAS